MMRRTLIVTAGAAAAALLASPRALVAQTYPAKPLRVVLPYPPGGTTDALLRPLAQYMSESLGQQVIVENRPGANGIIGSDQVAKSPADGYTLVLGAIGPLAVSSALQPLPYDPAKDFAPIAFLASVPNVLVVNTSTPIQTVAQLVEAARARSGELTYGSTGPGSSNQLSAELFNLAAGVKTRQIAYKGGAAAQVDLIGGQIAMIFDNMPAAIPQIRGGKLRPLAVTSLKRQPQLPDVPTMDELGFKGFEAGSWFGILAPAGTPRPIVDRLNAVIVQGLQSPALRERYEAMGYVLNPGSPEAFAAFIRSETEKWHRVVAQAGIRAE
jgi:tripartite-type tricarboxylate transporter receptor subunit TctC